MANLQVKRVVESTECPCCRQAPEDVLHALVVCLNIAYLCPRHLSVACSDVHQDFGSWWFELSKKESRESLNNLASLCLAIWNGRNQWVWKRQHRVAYQAQNDAFHMVNQWQEAQAKWPLGLRMKTVDHPLR